MGYAQFISSSYRAYAVDFDEDGYVDLFNSVDDAIGSIANYLYVHGWKREGKIVTKTYPNNVRKFYKPHESLTRFIPLTFNEDGKIFFLLVMITLGLLLSIILAMSMQWRFIIIRRVKK